MKTRRAITGANRGWLVLAAGLLLLTATGRGQELVDGEFGGIDLGRPLVDRSRFPTLAELREAVRRPQIETVVMFKLHGDGNNHYLPAWSADGNHLALQRSNIQERSSKLLLYHALGQTAPAPIEGPADAYDYMFRWGRNSPASFVFARIESRSPGVHLLFSPDGQTLTSRTRGNARHVMPSLYERTDRIWRLAYERDGQVVHEAYSLDEEVSAPLPLGRGTSPAWSSDGYRILMARARGSGQLAAYDIVVRNLRTEREENLSSSGIVRSPVWSPDERHAAFYVKEPGENKPWRIQVAPVDGGRGRTLGDDVVVNLNFETEGPCWQPDGKRLWFFSHARRRQAYYPLVAADVDGGGEIVVDYPNRCTTPGDLAINPVTAVPEIVFVAHDGLPQDVFVVFMNHF